MKKDRNNISNLYPLSPMQAGMLFHHLKDESGQSYVQQICWSIEGGLDITAYTRAWATLIQRHDILRTVFIYKNIDTPLQAVLQHRRWTPVFEDLRPLQEHDCKNRVAEAKTQARLHPFKLDEDCLLRLHILQTGHHTFEIILTHHHIIMDGWSLGSLVREALDIYTALIADAPLPNPHTPSYRDYIKRLQREDAETTLSFWRNYLQGFDTPTTPVGKSIASSSKKQTQDSIHLHLGEKQIADITTLAKECGVTLNTVFQTVWGLLLCRYNNSDDAVFGTVVSGRPHDLPDVEKMAGIFINTIPVRVQINDHMSLRDLLHKIQTEAAAAEKHHLCALGDIQNQTSLRNRLIGSLYVMENYPLDDLFELGREIEGTNFCVTHMETWEKTDFDFGIRLHPDQGMKIKIGFNPALYGREQVERIGAHLLGILDVFVKDGADTPLNRINPVTPQEQDGLLNLGTSSDEPQFIQQNIIERFKQQVKQTPDSVCLVAQKHNLTYFELDKHTDEIASHLTKILNIQADERIALCLERSHWSVIAILATLKAGAAYVPIEPGFPQERIDFILKDSGAKAVLCDPATINQFAQNKSQTLIDITADFSTPSQHLPAISSNNLAYVIYTSGTTGAPKGVMIEHGSVVHLAQAMNEQVYARHDKRLNMVLLTSYVFDGSVQQIFSALLHGHCLFIMDEESKRDPRKFSHFCIENQIDVAGCIPNFLALLHQSGELPKLGKHLRHMIFGGEALPVSLANQILSGPDAPTVTNLYGPTECCVNALTYSLSGPLPTHDGSVPIGTPLGACEIFILDRHGQLAPHGALGELCIGGPGVARGYLNNQALSKEKFVPHPFDANRRIYKTGDVARWNENGLVEFLGRNDQQIKIMGFRIEPGEIENRINQHPDILESAVIAHSDGNSLKAFIRTSNEIHLNALREFLSERLPTHMVPAQFALLEDMPRLVSGKIDRKALLTCPCVKLTEANTSDDICAPTTEMEETLLNVWQKVFARIDIGIDHDYFALGGDSIKAIQVLSQLYKQGLRLDIKDLFNSPSVRKLAPHLKENTFVEDATPQGELPLNPIQKRFFTTFSTNPKWFNHAILLNWRTPACETSLRNALTEMASQHDAFRLRYKCNEDGQWQQHFAQDTRSIDILTIDLGAQIDKERAIIHHANQAHTGFDLKKGPLAKALLFKTGGIQRVLLIVHHLIVDGISWRILLEDLAELYEAHQSQQQTPALQKSHSLKRWMDAVQAYTESSALLSELPYWNALANAPVPRLKVDMPRGSNRFCDIFTQSKKLDTPFTKALLGEINHAYNTSTEEILLCALSRALHKWQSLRGCLINLEGHGRSTVIRDVDINRTVGWFTNLFPVHLGFVRNQTIEGHLKTVKEMLRNIPHKGFGYGLLKYLSNHPNVTDFQKLEERSQISFNYLGQFENTQGTTLFDVGTDHTGSAIAPSAERRTELDIGVIVMDGQMEISLSYSAKRFLNSTMEQLLNHINDELHAIHAHCTGKEESEMTPSDLTLSGLSLDEFESLF